MYQNKVVRNSDSDNFLSGYVLNSKTVYGEDAGKYIVYCIYRKGITPDGVVPYFHSKMEEFSLDVEYAHLSETPRILAGLMRNYSLRQKDPKGYNLYMRTKDNGVYCTARTTLRTPKPSDQEDDIIIEYHFQKTDRGIVATHAIVFEVRYSAGKLKYFPMVMWISDYKPYNPFIVGYKKVHIVGFKVFRLGNYVPDMRDHKDVLSILQQYDVKVVARYDYDFRERTQPLFEVPDTNHGGNLALAYRARRKIALQSPLDLDNLPKGFKILDSFKPNQFGTIPIPIVTSYIGYLGLRKAVYVYVMGHLAYWKYYDYVGIKYPKELLDEVKLG